MKIEEIWTRSIREEIISALWLISAFLALQNGCKVFAILLFIKSSIDSCLAIIFCMIEASEIKRKLHK